MIARRNTRFVSLVFAESDVPLHTCQQLHHPVQHHRRARVHAPSLPLICQCIECQAKSLLVCVSACGTRQWTAFERARAGALRIAAAPHVAGEQLDATSSVSSCTCKRARAHTHTRTHARTHTLSLCLALSHRARAHTHSITSNRHHHPDSEVARGAACKHSYHGLLMSPAGSEVVKPASEKSTHKRRCVTRSKPVLACACVCVCV